jgi:hypothetical protein
MTAFTLLFALQGCLTRIKREADTNFQKLIGCVPDTIGIITLMQALSFYYYDCYSHTRDDNDSSQGTWVPHDAPPGQRLRLIGIAGIGYWCYLFCLFVGFIRTILHWMTPVPNGGMGITNLISTSAGILSFGGTLAAQAGLSAGKGLAAAAADPAAAAKAAACCSKEALATASTAVTKAAVKSTDVALHTDSLRFILV